MPGNTKNKDNTQLIAGLVTMALAVALMVGTVMCMRTCAAQAPTLATTLPTQTLGTPAATVQPGPTLAPNPYGPGDFAYAGDYLTCISGQSALGVDVSEYQGKIDWQQVADAGVGFAMIRLGFRAWGSEGNLYEDAYWRDNLQGAREAGLQVGVYFFSQAVDVAEAKEEARFLLACLDGAELSLPVVFDWETVPDENARTQGVTGAQLNDCAMAFCGEIEAAGYAPMVYFNQDQAKRMYDLQMLQDAGCGFWLAMYASSMTYPYKLSMWQYTSSGSVPGIQGYVDLDLYFTYE